MCQALPGPDAPARSNISDAIIKDVGISCMSLASHVPIGLHDTVNKLYQRILNMCQALPFRTCETTREYVKSIGFTIEWHVAREEEQLDGPLYREMQLFNINRDYKNVTRLNQDLHVPNSHAMYRLYEKNPQIQQYLQAIDVAIGTFHSTLYLWPAFLEICDDLKKAQDENADLRRQCSGVRLQTQNTDLSKLLTSLSRVTRPRRSPRAPCFLASS